MIAYRTFAQHKGITSRRMLESHEEVRAEARAFIAKDRQPEDIVNVAECALPSTWGTSLLTVTVLYVER